MTSFMVEKDDEFSRGKRNVRFVRGVFLVYRGRSSRRFLPASCFVLPGQYNRLVVMTIKGTMTYSRMSLTRSSAQHQRSHCYRHWK
jgi:hypothetical protein